MRFYILVSAFLFSTGVGSSQNGWRMIGHDASRTNRSPAIGPSALPSFQPLIQNISGTLRLIGPDGSLVFFNGTPNGGTLSSYSNTGTPKWVQGIALNDVAMMPNGTVVVSSITSHSVTALDKDTGRPIWPKPFTNGINGNETAGLAIDSSGVIYVVTGASFVGVPETLTAINPDGTLKWQNSQPGRGGVGPLLTNDESTVYIPFQPGVEALSAATGTEIGGAIFNVQLAAPWGSVYSTPRSAFSTYGLWECTLIACNQITSADVEGVATIVPPNTLIAVTNISPGLSRLQGIDRRTGNALWTATENLDYMIADANGTVYAVDLQTNDLVALNGLTGSQLWRQHFDYPTFALSPPLLGDDGSLYVTAGTTLYKTVNSKPVVIVVPGFGASTLTDAGGADQWLSCSSILSLYAGNLSSLRYDLFGNPSTTLATRDILTFTDSVTPGVFVSTQSVLDCSTSDLVTDVACTTNWFNCDLAKAAEKLGSFGRNQIQTNIVSNSHGVLLQFNDPNNSLIGTLAINGYSPLPWKYDFRRDIDALADDLYATVQQVPLTRPGRPVAIVAHSMGSLITAVMIARHPNVNLSNVISMGAPFEGGTTTYLYAQGWRPFAPFLSAPNTASLGQNWTSVYELLPQWKFVDDTVNNIRPSPSSIYQGLFDSRTFPPLPRASQTPVINAQQSVWSELTGLSSQPFWNAIIGHNQDTAQQIVRSDQLVGSDPASTPITLSKPCYTVESDDGDGEVPLISSQGGIIPATKIYVQEQHAMLPKNGAVIKGIVDILNGSSPFGPDLLSDHDFQQLRASLPFALQDTILINACSPVNVAVTDSSGATISSQVSQIVNAKYANIGDATQLELPWNDMFQVHIAGTGAGALDLVVRGFGGQHTPLSYIFRAVPVLNGSQGTVLVGTNSVPALQYNYAGKNVVDTIPANSNPPTVVCTGCYFVIQGLRATFAFNVGYPGGVSTFTYNYRNSSRTVQFLSTVTSQIAVSGNTATFSGQGTLNGQTGYSSTVTAKDGGPAGSGLDTISVTITGPNNYSYSASATVIGGNVIVHQ